jgi:hypothetical protein
MTIINVQQNQQVYIYLLCRKTEARFGYCLETERVFTNKVQAEAVLRLLEDDWKSHETDYYIVEHITEPNNNHV